MLCLISGFVLKEELRTKLVDPPVPDFLPGPSEGFDYSIQMAVKAIIVAIPIPPDFRILFSVKLPKISCITQAILSVS